jgi:hypothetical protein
MIDCKQMIQSRIDQKFRQHINCFDDIRSRQHD